MLPFNPKKTGTHSFYLTSDDGARLYINNKIMIDSWHDHDAFTDVVDAELTAGKEYAIKVEYYDHSGTAVVSLNVVSF